MPKLTTFTVTVPGIIDLARMNLQRVKTPEESTDIILKNVYQNIANSPNPIIAAELFGDHEILHTIDGCRDETTKRIFFNLTRMGIFNKTSGTLSVFALQYNHLSTALTLLREERASWGSDKSSIMRGSTQATPEGLTWFHKMLQLAACFYEYYKDDKGKHAELKECLHSVLDAFKDILDLHPMRAKSHLINNLVKYFNKLPQFKAAGDMLTLFATDIIATAGAGGIAPIIKDYELTADARLQRQDMLMRLGTAGDADEERGELIGYLKTRYNLCALLSDRIFFEETNAHFSPLHAKALLEAVVILAANKQILPIKILLSSLSQEKAQTALDYIFETASTEYIDEYLKSHLDRELSQAEFFLVVQHILEINHILIKQLGDNAQQLCYFHSKIMTRGLHQADNPLNAQFIRNLSIYFCSYLPGYAELDKLAAEDSAPTPLEFQSHPQLVDKFSGKLSTLIAHSAKALADKERLTRELGFYSTYLWHAYLVHMWIEFNNIPSPEEYRAFNILDYIFEKILKNPSTYPRLHAHLKEIIYAHTQSSNKKIEYLFKYKTGSDELIARKIQVTEAVRQSIGKEELVKGDFEEELNALKENTTTLALAAKIDIALLDKSDSIYKQLAFLTAWTTWAESKEEHAPGDTSRSFKFLFDHLLTRTPFAKQLKDYVHLVEHRNLDDSPLDYLLMLAGDKERLDAFNFELLLDKLVFTKESAQATLLFYLFFYQYYTTTGQHLNLALFFERVFTVLSTQFDNNSLKQTDFAAFYDELAKHKFFKSLVNNEFCATMYRSYRAATPQSIPSEELVCVTERSDTECAAEAPLIPKKAHRRRRRKNAHKTSDTAASAGAGCADIDENDSDSVADLSPIDYPVEPAALKILATEGISTDIELMQSKLKERLKLPRVMPVLNLINELFCKEAKLAVFGSALFFANPLDIDLKLTWIDPEVSLETAKSTFERLIKEAGFTITFTRELIGEISFTLQGRGDGYNLDDHKEIDLTLQIANPRLRAKALHHNSHCAASFDISNGIIDCDSDTATAVAEGIFELYPHIIENPLEAFKAKVQTLTSLMRAWGESIEGTLRLSTRAQALFDKISMHKGNWDSLNACDESLAKALQGMITRHFMHYQAYESYQKRSALLFNFLTALGISSGIELATARAIKSILLTDLSLYPHYYLTKTEGFLIYCSELSLPINPAGLKESLTAVLQIHCNRYVEGPEYLRKTASLVHFCQRLGFHLMAQIPGSPLQYELLGVNASVLYFSTPRIAIDSPQMLYFTPSAALYEANYRAIQLQMLTLASMSIRPPISTPLITSAPTPARGSGFFAKLPAFSGDKATGMVMSNAAVKGAF